MKILFLYDGEYPWDIRVAKLCDSFIRQGHVIHMVCRNKEGKNRLDSYNGVHIHRVFSVSKFNFLNNPLTFPAFFNPVWLWELYRQVKNNRCELIVVRDLPLALSAVFIKRILRVPVVLDMAECYPEMLRCIWIFNKKKLKNIFIRNPLLADVVEKIVMKNIDSVLVMVEESKDRLLKFGIPSEKVHIVSNTPEIKRYVEQYSTEQKDTALKLIYVGLVSRSRGIEVCIRAIKSFKEKVDDSIRMVIVGTGADLDRLKHLSYELGLNNNIEFSGWVDNGKVPELIRMNNIGVVPHRKCSHWNSTIPNKLFDYMASSIPVLVSNVTPMERIVNETGAGLVFDDMNVDDFVEKLLLLRNEKLRTNLGQNGRRAVLQKYNWAAEEQVLHKVMGEFNT